MPGRLPSTSLPRGALALVAGAAAPAAADELVNALAIVIALLGDEAAPVSPVWGALNALLNALTLITVAAIYTRRR